MLFLNNIQSIKENAFMNKYIIGVDLGGTEIKYGLFEPNGNVVKKWTTTTGKYDDGTKVFKDIADSIKDSLEKENIMLDNIEGVGIGVPGAVLESDIINKCVNLNMGVTKVSEVFSPLLGNKKAVAINDANAAALGEMWQGSGQNYHDLVFITIGTGVGGAVILNNKLLEGTFGAGGEIGHIKVNENEKRVCGCGGHGCLEQYSSATGIVNNYKQVIGREDTNVTAKDIFEMYAKGDDNAKKALDIFAKAMGMGLANVSAVVDPEIFIIGGGVSKAGDVLIDLIQDEYKKHAFHASVNTKFANAILLNDAGIYGAAYAALHA